ncbi:hypothetical protein, partial [Pseudomonas tolaasii]
QPASMSLPDRLRGQARSHTEPLLLHTTQVGFQAAVLLILILGTPKRERGAECWGKSLLVTFGWAGIPALFKSDPP